MNTKEHEPWTGLEPAVTVARADCILQLGMEVHVSSLLTTGVQTYFISEMFSFRAQNLSLGL
jgi:hypothetical protein